VFPIFQTYKNVYSENSNEWQCQQVLTIPKYFCKFLCHYLNTDRAIITLRINPPTRITIKYTLWVKASFSGLKKHWALLGRKLGNRPDKLFQPLFPHFGFLVVSSAKHDKIFWKKMPTCGTFLHHFPNLGYRKRNLLNTSSMPLDGAPTTPTWPRDLVPRPPSMFHIILFSHWSRSGKSFRRKSLDSSTGFGSRETAANRGFPFIEYCSYFLLILRHFDTCLGFWYAKIPTVCFAILLRAMFIDVA
jgi:hypothetical protein